MSAILYISLDDIFDLIRSVGSGYYIIKYNIKDAFYNIPIAIPDCALIAFIWEGITYIECCLPFSLTTVPFIFNLFAEGLNWLLSALLPFATVVHYLDNFIAIIPASIGSLYKALDSFKKIYIPLTNALGIPCNDSKDAAGTIVVSLGIEIDTLLL